MLSRHGSRREIARTVRPDGPNDEDKEAPCPFCGSHYERGLQSNAVIANEIGTTQIQLLSWREDAMGSGIRMISVRLGNAELVRARPRGRSRIWKSEISKKIRIELVLAPVLGRFPFQDE